ncbi:EFR1 family ferrodoxin [Anaerosporobacter faecicola]|uniref:EFR1 family ferrodoxin n=1 Tax=Anaerosporobacter faecicola TaxID=2718714 RepID=UPI00143A3968|nr:EFR1 family ferrodoxin [Anaerosporobacter faecicola]
MTILYFSTTGNNIYVAKKFGGKAISMVQANKQEKLEFVDDQIGIVVPVYGLCIPPYVNEFLHKVTLRSPYIFGVVTYGFYAGATINQLEKIGKECGIPFAYINKLEMVENYLPGFEMEKEKKKHADVDEKLSLIINDVKEKQKKITRATVVGKFLTKTHEMKYAYPIGIGTTTYFQVEDSCTGCGICGKVCPMDNIELKEKPVFGQQCSSCMACTQNCPKNAIRMTNEKSRARYRNEHVSLEEIIKANQ